MTTLLVLILLAAGYAPLFAATPNRDAAVPTTRPWVVAVGVALLFSSAVVAGARWGAAGGVSFVLTGAMVSLAHMSLALPSAVSCGWGLLRPPPPRGEARLDAR